MSDHDSDADDPAGERGQERGQERVVALPRAVADWFSGLQEDIMLSIRGTCTIVLELMSSLSPVDLLELEWTGRMHDQAAQAIMSMSMLANTVQVQKVARVVLTNLVERLGKLFSDVRNFDPEGGLLCERTALPRTAAQRKEEAPGVFKLVEHLANAMLKICNGDYDAYNPARVVPPVPAADAGAPRVPPRDAAGVNPGAAAARMHRADAAMFGLGDQEDFHLNAAEEAEAARNAVPPNERMQMPPQQPMSGAPLPHPTSFDALPPLERAGSGLGLARARVRRYTSIRGAAATHAPKIR